MGKIFPFLFIIPILFVTFLKVIAFYEFDTKERYIKDQVDNLCYKVKITGVLSTSEIDDFRNKLNGMADFNDSGIDKTIILRKGNYVNGSLQNLGPYIPGEALNKGDAFLIYVKSNSVSNYSRIHNGGVNSDDSKNLYYKAKAVCRIESYN